MHAQLRIDTITNRHLRLRAVCQLIPVLAAQISGELVAVHLAHAGDDARIPPGTEPLHAVETGAHATVVVGERAEREQFRHTNHIFTLTVAQRDDSAMRARQQDLTLPNTHSGVPSPESDDLQIVVIERIIHLRPAAATRMGTHHGLSPCDLIPRFRPGGVMRQLLTHLIHHLMHDATVGQTVHVREADVEASGASGRHLELIALRPCLTSVQKHPRHKHGARGALERIRIGHAHTAPIRFETHAGILCLHLLRLRRHGGRRTQCHRR